MSKTIGEREADTGAKSTALCTHCGICCSGVIHDRAVLQPDEVAGARLLGLPLENREKPTFSLPCPKYDGTVCTIYENRPLACQRYRCQVLQDLEAGDMSFEEAIGHVDMAKGLMLRVEAHMPPEMTFAEARAATIGPAKVTCDEPSDDLRRQMQLRLEATALSLYVDLHFRNERDGQVLGLTPIKIDNEEEI